MKLDIIIPLKTSLTSLAIRHTIPSVRSKLSYNNIYIVTKRDNFSMLAAAFGTNLKLIDEDKVCDGLSLNQVQKYFQRNNENVKRAAWYFQQFLKLGIAKLDFISSSYLVWDADAVVLNPINFFSEKGKVYITKSKEYNKPYFELIEKIIGIKRQVNYSFISEHLVFNKKIVLSLLNEISGKNDHPWWLTILENIAIDNLSKSGFSEYELYGNYLAKYYPHHFQVRNLYKTRRGAACFGMAPRSFDLMLSSFVFDYMSFEERPEKYKSILLYRFFKTIEVLSVKMAEKALKRSLAKLLSLFQKKHPSA